MIQLKRARERPSPADGLRVLVERFWPRDLDEKHARVDLWLKEAAPSVELHQAFGECPGPERWPEFERLYGNELSRKHRSLKVFRKADREGTLTLLHAAHDPGHSGAAVLKHFLETAGSKEK